jgi:polysaccharide pyruvyl transferase WcaK-like protein
MTTRDAALKHAPAESLRGAPRPRPVDAQAKRDTARRVAIFGLFGAGNHGNEASLEVVLDMLRRERPDAELFCVCAGPERVAADHEVASTLIWPSRTLTGWALSLHRLFLRAPAKLVDFVAAFRTMRRHDVLIVPGTGILDDFCERPTGMPLSIFLWCLAARAARAKICMLSIGAGPIDNRLSRLLMVSAARLAHLRSYRDRSSKDFMQEAGIDTSRDRVEPDLVFLMQTPEASLEPAIERGRRLTVGVGVMGYHGWYGESEGAIFSEYMEKLVRFVRHLVTSGHDVRLLVGDSSDDAVGVETILASARDHSRAGASIVAEPISSLHDLMRQIAGTDIVVATRFHNVVGALKLGKPTISLGYARKNDVLMDEMGLAAYAHHVERFDVDTLIRQVAELAARRPQVEAAISARTSAFRDSLRLQEQRLLSAYL